MRYVKSSGKNLSEVKTPNNILRRRKSNIYIVTRISDPRLSLSRLLYVAGGVARLFVRKSFGPAPSSIG